MIDLDNIYHICVAKTGSMWIEGIFKHPLINAYTSMPVYNFESDRHGWDYRGFMDRHETEAFPKKTVCCPTYMGLDCYLQVPKPDKYKSFCVVRDPRDLVTSFYFSIMYSHAQMGLHPQWRQRLSRLDRENGFIEAIKILDEFQMFEASRSYRNCSDRDPNCKLYTFEDLTGENHFEVFKDLFAWLTIPVSSDELSKVLTEKSFERLSGRKKGQENEKHHYRKGVVGDWKNYFTENVEQNFYNTTGDLISHLEY